MNIGRTVRVFTAEPVHSPVPADEAPVDVVPEPAPSAPPAEAPRPVPSRETTAARAR